MMDVLQSQLWTLHGMCTTTLSSHSGYIEPIDMSLKTRSSLPSTMSLPIPKFWMLALMQMGFSLRLPQMPILYKITIYMMDGILFLLVFLMTNCFIQRIMALFKQSILILTLLNLISVQILFWLLAVNLM